MDKFFEIFFFRAVLATGVGLGLELFFNIVASTMFLKVDFMQAMAHPETMTGIVISLAVFHIIGWILVCLDWDALTKGSQPVAQERFIMERGGHIYDVTVRSK